MSTDINTILWAIVAIMVILTVVFYKDKKDTAMLAGIVAVLLASILIFTTGGIDSGNETYTYAVAPSGQPTGEACQVKPYTSLKVSTQVEGSNSYVTAAGTAYFYEEGVNPSDPNANAYDTATVTSGVGATTNAKLSACTVYGIVFGGANTYYDQWYNGETSSYLPYIETDESAIASATIRFDGIMTVATIDDPITENSVTGVVNGQTAVNTTGDGQEIILASDADGAVLAYDESFDGAATGQFYLDLALGASGSNGFLKNPVLCFVSDLTQPFNGNEFSSVSMERRTGTDFGIPSSITNYVNDGSCISLGSTMEGGQSGTYRVTFNVDESNFDTDDIMYIYMDDLGSHLGQDILRGPGATASAVVTITSQA